MKPVTLIICLATVAGAFQSASAQLATQKVVQDAQEYANGIDLQQVMYASRWEQAFKRLDPKNNICIAVSMDDNMIEIENVFRVEAYSRFLIVEARNKLGKFYKSIVYPSNILLIQEKGYDGEN